MKKNIIAALAAAATIQASGNLICYVPSWSEVGSAASYRNLLDTMDYSSYSHVVYCFATPTNIGTLYNPVDTSILRILEKRGHESGAKVLLAFGGGAGPSYEPDTAFLRISENPEYMKRYIDTLMYFVREFNLDGLDNDWEPYWETRAQRRGPYELLMTNIRDSLKDKILMADIYLNPSTCTHLSDSSLAMMDLINLMTYENNFGPNFETSIEIALSQWKSKGISMDKITTILPFWGCKQGTWGPNYLYKDIMKSHPESADKDSITIDGGVVWFGSKRVIHSLTKLAGKECGGTGFWHIGLDSPGEHSLVSVMRSVTDSINGTATQPKITAERSPISCRFSEGTILLNVPGVDRCSIILYSLSGRRLMNETVELRGGLAELSLRNYSFHKGVIITEVQSDGQKFTTTFLNK